MSKIVGIDLGTSKSVAAFIEAGRAVLVPSREGSLSTPSVVGFSKIGEVLVGEVAKRQAITNPDRTIRSVKRHMGTDWTITIDKKKYKSQEISARILQKLKRDAEAYVGDTVSQAVITVPAYFDDAQRQATKEAGTIAGLEVLYLLSSPTAAALAYGLDKEGAEQTIVVFDLGGGTFDVSILEIGEGVFEVKATSGNTRLGGDDWDQKVIDWLVEQFKGDHGVDLAKDKVALQRLKEAAEKAKIELSTTQESQINLPFITASDAGPLHLDYMLTRANFQELTADLVEACRGPFEQAMKDAGVTGAALNQVIMVGGCSRMPAIQNLVKSMTGKEPYKGVNPDEVVAAGAAIEAGVVTGEIKDVLLLDVTPLSVGIETRGGIMTKLIERNTTIPTRRTEVFTTAEDTQPSVEIHVLQGEREMAAFNKTLGKFQLVGLPPAPRGVPQIEVTFAIDAHGIVHVSAKDMATNREQSMTVSGQSALTSSELERMKRNMTDASDRTQGASAVAKGGKAVPASPPVRRSPRNPLPSGSVRVSSQTRSQNSARLDGTVGVPLDGDMKLRSEKTVFLCYAHQDQTPDNWRDRLRDQLKPLRSKGIGIWDDHDIGPGKPWRSEIVAALDSADAAVLLVGSAFLNSEFISDHELPRLLAGVSARGVRVFPLIVGYCLYQLSDLGELQSFNDPRQPLESLTRPEQNRILHELAQEIGSTLS